MSRPLLALPAAVVTLLLVGCGPFGRMPGEELCDALESDLQSALAASKEPPEVHDDDPLRHGTCSVTKTKRFDVKLPGVERHEESTISGQVAMEPSRDLRRIKAASKADPANRVTPLPQLGREAFLVLQAGPSVPGGPGQPTGAPVGNSMSGAAHPNAASLPATAYWQHGKATFSASGAREGATVEETIRITQRLAELLNRRPIQTSID